MESFLKSFERREEKNLLSGGGRFLSKEGRKMNRLSITIIIELQLIDQRREWKIILGNLSKEGKKKIHFLEEEDFFLKREGK